jgi:hypothetical protein
MSKTSQRKHSLHKEGFDSGFKNTPAPVIQRRVKKLKKKSDVKILLKGYQDGKKLLAISKIRSNGTEEL